MFQAKHHVRFNIYKKKKSFFLEGMKVNSFFSPHYSYDAVYPLLSFPGSDRIGLIQVKEEGWTGFLGGWQGCFRDFPRAELLYLTEVILQPKLKTQ